MEVRFWPMTAMLAQVGRVMRCTWRLQNMNAVDFDNRAALGLNRNGAFKQQVRSPLLQRPQAEAD